MSDDRRQFVSGNEKPAQHESGSALVLALLIMVIMTLLGLAFVLMGETEAKIARNTRDASQALFAAEGATRLARNWFEKPNGSLAYLVPTTAQMDRTQRWVDPEFDGTYVSYSTAGSPYNVTYKSSTNDPFEKPYTGAPADLFLGNEDHPDVVISETGGVGQVAYLTSLNNTLYTSFPANGQRVAITEIKVYGAPMLYMGGTYKRGGLATIKVTAGVYEFYGTTAQTKIATRVVKAVISELPYAGGGALQSCKAIDMAGNVSPHWGLTSASTTLDLQSNIDVKVDSSVPYALDTHRFIAPDMNQDGTISYGASGVGTPDDQDGDGTLDFDAWLATADVEDPWLKFWSEGNVTAGGKAISPGCSTPDCQPDPFYQSPSTFGTGPLDHSNIFKNVATPLCPDFEYELWKAVAQSGASKCYYFSSDGSGTGTYKLNGAGSSLDFQTASDGLTGILFFDSATNTAPVDADANGTYDNLSADVTLSGGGLTTGGLTYLNANINTSGSGSVTVQKTLVAPEEPYIDTNGNGAYDSDEWFVDLTYPGSVTSTYGKNGMRRVVDGYARNDPAKDATTTGKWLADINFYGILYTSGTFDSQGNWIYFGSIVTKSGQTHPGSSGTPTFYYDDRMRRGLWPPADMGLPRTIITAWQTD